MIFVGVLEGIVIAIFLAVLLFFRRNWWPHGAVIGRIDGIDGWHDIEGHDDARGGPGIVVYRWEAPLFFANAGAFRRQVRHLVRERTPAWVVVQCEAVTDIDVTAAGMLRQLDEELNGQGIHMAFVEMRSRLQELVQSYGLFETLDRDHFYPSVESALAAIRPGGTVSSTSVPVSTRRRAAAVVALVGSVALVAFVVAVLFGHGAHVVIGLVGLAVAVAGGWWVDHRRACRAAPSARSGCRSAS